MKQCFWWPVAFWDMLRSDPDGTDEGVLRDVWRHQAARGWCVPHRGTRREKTERKRGDEHTRGHETSLQRGVRTL